MPESQDFTIPPEQEQLHQILAKIMAHQYSLPEDRAVDLDELFDKGVLSTANARKSVRCN